MIALPVVIFPMLIPQQFVDDSSPSSYGRTALFMGSSLPGNINAFFHDTFEKYAYYYYLFLW
jgi:hypothetical protein